MKKQKFSQSSIVLMLVILICKIVGMLRDIVLANYYGTSNISDAYLIASSVPTLLFYFIGHSLSTAYIPMYNQVKAKYGIRAADNFTNNILNISLVIGTVIVFILLVAPNIVVKLFAAGFDKETSKIAITLIRISAMSIFLMIIIHILGGYLQANKSFLAPAAISFPRNIAIVGSVVISAKYGIIWLGIGILVAYLLELIFLLPFVLFKGYRYRPIIKFKDKTISQTLYVVTPILLGMCVGQINKIVDRSMASMVTEGGISALTYASVINNAIQEILVTGIITILFSSCAELVASGKHKEVKRKLSHTINTLLFFLTPACAGVIVLAEPIVRFILCRGEFDTYSLNMTTNALKCYTLGLVFLALRDTFVKVFYAYKETRITTIISIASILLNIILNIVLGRFIGIHGLALATSISAIFNCILLMIFMFRKIGDFGVLAAFKVFAKSLLCSIAMALVVNYMFSRISNVCPELVSMVLSILAGIVFYWLISLILGISKIIKPEKIFGGE